MPLHLFTAGGASGTTHFSVKTPPTSTWSSWLSSACRFINCARVYMLPCMCKSDTRLMLYLHLGEIFRKSSLSRVCHLAHCSACHVNENARTPEHTHYIIQPKFRTGTLTNHNSFSLVTRDSCAWQRLPANILRKKRLLSSPIFAVVEE